jgi:ribosomal 30S subunit maturation factor RimM
MARRGNPFRAPPGWAAWAAEAATKVKAPKSVPFQRAWVQCATLTRAHGLSGAMGWAVENGRWPAGAGVALYLVGGVASRVAAGQAHALTLAELRELAGGQSVATFEETPDRTAVEKYEGAQVWIDPDDLAPEEEADAADDPADEAFPIYGMEGVLAESVLGYTALSAGVVLGTIEQFDPTLSGHGAWRVMGEPVDGSDEDSRDQGREWIIPAVSAFIARIDNDRRELHLTLPDGFDDL